MPVLPKNASAREKTGQSGIHDQRGGGALQASSADAAAVRARRAAEAVAFAGKHAVVYGFGSGAAGRDPDAGAPDGGVRASGATGIVAGGGLTHAGETTAACDCAGGGGFSCVCEAATRRR